MRCNDPLVRALQSLGYNVLRLPSAGFKPKLLLESDGRQRTEPIGFLEEEIPAAAGQPPVRVKRGDPAPDIKLNRTRQLGGHLGVRFLQPLLELLGVAPGVIGSLRRASKLEIVLKNVRRDWISRGDLARYLESGVGVGSEHVRRAADKNRLFVATSILKSTSVVTVVGRDIAQTIEAKSDAPSTPVSVTVKHGRQSADRSQVTFKGPTPLAFAFQAVHLIYEDGIYSDYQSAQGLTGYAWDTDTGVADGTLLLRDDLNEIEVNHPR